MRVRSLFLLPLALAGALLAGCESATEPIRQPAAFVLESVNDRALPAPYFSSQQRAQAIVGGSMALDPLGGDAGTAVETVTLRITEAGQPPRDEVRVRRGTYELDGDLLRVRFENTTGAVYRVEGGGSVLRTVSTSCGELACLDVLIVYVFRRAVALD